MMTISNGSNLVSEKTGGNVQAGGLGRGMLSDPVSRNIQNQIASAQEQLQALSSNEDMTLEEKMKKRQEIQQEITSLNQQLRQHQIQQRKEQREKSASANGLLGESQKAGMEKQGRGLSQTGMQSILSADASLKQAKAQGSIAQRMEGKANVLKVEIKLDKNNTERKEAELADVERKAMDAIAAQADTLADANREIREGMKADRADSKKEKTEKKEEEKTGSGAATEDPKADNEEEALEADTGAMTSQQAGYRPVDVRL